MYSTYVYFKYTKMSKFTERLEAARAPEYKLERITESVMICAWYTDEVRDVMGKSKERSPMMMQVRHAKRCWSIMMHA